MDSDPVGSSIIGLIVSFILSSFFSVVKIIFNAIDKNALPADSEGHRFYASKIEDLRENKNQLASTVSFGKTLSNALFVALTFWLVTRQFPERTVLARLGLTVGVSVLVLSVFAYAVPRAFAQRFPIVLMPSVYFLFGPLNALFFFFSRTLVAINKGLLAILGYDEKFAFLSKEEKQRMNEGSVDEQALDEEEKEMIHSIFEFGETTVKEIMVPRIDVEGLELNTDFRKVLGTIKDVGHSRIPVYRENIDTIVGVLYAKDILAWIYNTPNGTWNLESLLKQPHYVPVGKKIDDLLAEFKTRQIHIAIVVDEYGGTAGIVTLEDILEEIVGEIQDEYDEEEAPLVQLSEDTYDVDPHYDLDDLKEELELDLDLEGVDYNTLGGLIYHAHGDVPKEGTEVEHDGLRIKVIKMDGQRIDKVQLVVLRRRHDSPDLEGSF